MAVGDLWEVVFVTTADDQVGLNVRHYRTEVENGGEITSLAVATWFDVAFVAPYIQVMSFQSIYRGATAQRIAPLPAGSKAGSAVNQTPGVVLEALLPRQVCGLITYRAALSGRMFRGRSYIPFPGEIDNEEGGKPSAGYVVRLQNLATALGAPQTVPGIGQDSLLVPVILHRTTLTADNIVGATARSGWATQRRRGSFGATNQSPL